MTVGINGRQLMAIALIIEAIAEPERAEDCEKALRKIKLSDDEHAIALMMAHSIASELISLGERREEACEA